MCNHEIGPVLSENATAVIQETGYRVIIYADGLRLYFIIIERIREVNHFLYLSPDTICYFVQPSHFNKSIDYVFFLVHF